MDPDATRPSLESSAEFLSLIHDSEPKKGCGVLNFLKSKLPRFTSSNPSRSGYDLDSPEVESPEQGCSRLKSEKISMDGVAKHFRRNRSRYHLAGGVVSVVLGATLVGTGAAIIGGTLGIGAPIGAPIMTAGLLIGSIPTMYFGLHAWGGKADHSSLKKKIATAFPGNEDKQIKKGRSCWRELMRHLN